MDSKDKPVVRYYEGTLEFYQAMDGREHASCWAIDHPDTMILNEWVRTSTVLVKHPNGSFETRNSIYVPTAKPPVETDFSPSVLGGGHEQCNHCGAIEWALSTRNSRHAANCKYIESLRSK